MRSPSVIPLAIFVELLYPNCVCIFLTTALLLDLVLFPLINTVEILLDLSLLGELVFYLILLLTLSLELSILDLLLKLVGIAFLLPDPVLILLLKGETRSHTIGSLSSGYNVSILISNGRARSSLTKLRQEAVFCSLVVNLQ